MVGIGFGSQDSLKGIPLFKTVRIYVGMRPILTERIGARENDERTDLKMTPSRSGRVVYCALNGLSRIWFTLQIHESRMVLGSCSTTILIRFGFGSIGSHSVY